MKRKLNDRIIELQRIRMRVDNNLSWNKSDFYFIYKSLSLKQRYNYYLGKRFKLKYKTAIKQLLIECKITFSEYQKLRKKHKNYSSIYIYK